MTALPRDALQPFALHAGAKASRACLVSSNSGSRSVVSAGHLPDIASDPDTVMRVAELYTAAEVARHIFGQDWFALAPTRFAGKHLDAIEALAAGLREGEATVRPLAWDEAMAQRLLEEPGVAPVRRPIRRRNIAYRAGSVLVGVSGHTYLGLAALIMVGRRRSQPERLAGTYAS